MGADRRRLLGTSLGEPLNVPLSQEAQLFPLTFHFDYNFHDLASSGLSKVPD